MPSGVDGTTGDAVDELDLQPDHGEHSYRELAPFYVFLASQESSYMTSEVLGVTGGSPIT